MHHFTENVPIFTILDPCLGRPSGSVSAASALASGHDARVLGLSPKSGSLLSEESTSLFPSAPPLAQAHMLSLK